MLRDIGAPEILLILLVVVLLFGAKKLPDTARGLGRSLRIFKAETKGLMTDDEGQSVPPAEPRTIQSRPTDVTEVTEAKPQPEAEHTDH
jgi:sec-independent protein translocase protein TatA